MMWTVATSLTITMRRVVLVLVCVLCMPASGSSSRCAALDEVDVRYFDVPSTTLAVPDNELTTYVCQVVKIPIPVDEHDFHAVAFQPLIDNHDVMHHMILFACSGHDEIQEEFLKPHACGRADNLCRSWMAQWSVGVEGTLCPHKGTGVRFGHSVGSHLLLQIHWNNAKLQKNLTDHSSMRVFYTSKLRPHDLGHVQVGQQELVIPPGQTRHPQSGGCSAECTQMLFPQPIHITTYHLHMHNLGAGGWLEVIHRDGNTTRIAHDDSYDFLHPPRHNLAYPVTVLPGDYLRLTCLYNTKEGLQRRNKTIFFGEGSDAEMCYAFLAYYPKLEGFDQCLQLGSLDINCPTSTNSVYRECTSRFPSMMASQFIPDILSACNKTDEELCYDGCKQALDVLDSHQCMQGGLGGYLQRDVLPTVTGWRELQHARTRLTRLCGTLSVM